MNEKIFSIALNERTAAEIRNRVGKQRTNLPGKACCEHRKVHIHFPTAHEKTCESEDDFAWNGNVQRIDRHQEKDSRVRKICENATNQVDDVRDHELRIRREFRTTDMEEKALAAEAMMGFRSPSAASGIPTTLYTKAQKRFCLIVPYVRCASLMPSTTFSVPPPTRTICPASIAMSVPLPIATPRSACVSAGASLMPSPTNATFFPCCCKSR